MYMYMVGVLTVVLLLTYLTSFQSRVFVLGVPGYEQGIGES